MNVVSLGSIEPEIIIWESVIVLLGKHLPLENGNVDLSRSSSRWYSHFHSYVITLYIRLY